MKWPFAMGWIRHAQSAYNILRELKEKDPLYQEFLAAFNNDFQSEDTKRLAILIWKKYGLGVGDYNTPITEIGFSQARTIGLALPNEIELPDVVFISPHQRAYQTRDGIIESWPELAGVPVVEEPRLREQEHGLSLIYNDWRIFHTFYPEQKWLYEMEGPYWYRFPQGENAPDGIERARSFIGTIVRDYSEKKVLVISHHLTLLFFLAAILRWDCNEFVKWDDEKKPINCGLTIFRGNPSVGDNGRLELVDYNKKLY